MHTRPTREKARPASGGSGCVGMHRVFSRGKRILRPPVSRSGRRSVLWCALSRLISPLAFAGFAAGAKPNHGFFVCQQLGRFFFAPAAAHPGRAEARAHVATRVLHAAACGLRDRCIFETSFFKGFFSRVVDAYAACDPARILREPQLVAHRTSRRLLNSLARTALRECGDQDWPSRRRTSRRPVGAPSSFDRSR